MAEIIDLDFYRKFRVILPVRSALAEGKGKKGRSTAKTQARRHYRRRKRTADDLSNNQSKK